MFSQRFYLFYVHERSPDMNVCVLHMNVWYPQKSEESVRSLKLEVQVVMSHPVGAGN